MDIITKKFERFSNIYCFTDSEDEEATTTGTT